MQEDFFEFSQFSRTELLLGTAAISHLSDAHVAIFGVGGVGGYTAEALARCGIGKITLVDNDTVSLTNLNRQIIALHSTIGKPKVEVMKERILDINPACSVTAKQTFFSAETSDEFDFSQYDYVVDAIDTVSAKILLIQEAKKADCKIICAMGAGNKLNPTKFEVTDISKTSVCPLARVMRYELKKRGIKNVKVVYSKEEPINPLAKMQENQEFSEHKSEQKFEQKGNGIAPGSISFVPSVAGLIIAGEVVKDLISVL